MLISLTICPLSTILLSISSTLSRPDISDDPVIVLELSVVTNSEEHFKAANFRKEAQCGSLISDLELAGFTASLVTIEVDCLGDFLPTSVFNICRVSEKIVSEIF